MTEELPAAARFPGPRIPAARRGSVLDAVAFTRDPERYLRRRAQEDGDPFFVGFPGVGPVLVTGSADGARALFSAPAETFEPPGPNPVEPLLGSGSLILLSGERHRRERRLLTPAFHGEALRAYARDIRDIAVTATDALPPDERVCVHALARSITLDVIVRVVFGVRDGERQRRFRGVITAMLDAYTAPLVALPALRRRFFGLGPWARFDRLRTAFVALLGEEMDGRRARSPSDDVLSALLAVRDEDGAALPRDALVDELSTLLVAGHETSATALAWAMYFVGRDPALEAALRDELRAAGPSLDETTLADHPLLGATVQEALRVHPVVPLVLRRARVPFVVRGVTLAPGDVVALALPLLHHDVSVYEAPERFDPHRFVARKASPFALAPFGGGARRCLGAAFATAEMKIILGVLLAKRRWALEPGPAPRPVVRNITMGPHCPLFMRTWAA